MTRASQGQTDGPTMPLSVQLRPDSLCPEVTAEYWGLLSLQGLQSPQLRRCERKANPQAQVRKCYTCRCSPGGFPLNHQILKSQLGGSTLALGSGGAVGWGGGDVESGWQHFSGSNIIGSFSIYLEKGQRSGACLL